MMAADTRRIRLFASLAVLSAAVILYELVLMQILSLVQWHHFAFMIVAVALLGFGAAGTLLFLLRPRLLAHGDTLLPLLICSGGIAMALVPAIAQGSAVRFDSLLLFTGGLHLFKLSITYLLYLLPFGFTALAIGLIFVRGAGEIGRLYFWNLAGSGAGGAALLCLAWWLPPARLPGVVALLLVAAALLVLPEGLQSPPPFGKLGSTALLPLPQASPPSPAPGHTYRRTPWWWRLTLFTAPLLAGLASVAVATSPPVLRPSEFKPLSHALHLPDARIIHERSSPYGLLQVVSSPALRNAPGLSLAYRDPIPVQQAVFNNGEWFGTVLERRNGTPQTFLDHTTGALPYSLARRRQILILDAGTGSAISQALGQGVQGVTAVEAHAAISPLLREMSVEGADNPYDHPSVATHRLASRTFLFLNHARYDLVLLPTVNSFGGDAGLQAIHEQYLFTREAFGQIWRTLTPDGVMAVTVWIDAPLRHPLKILATLVEAIEEEGCSTIRSRLAAVRSWGTITFLVKKTPLSPAETQKIRNFCNRLWFDPLLLPDLFPQERMRFNALSDDRLFFYLEAILSPARSQFYVDYPFDIRPASDDRPYFAQFLRWQSIGDLTRLYGAHSFPFLEAGYLLLLLTLLQVTLIAAVLILLPLCFRHRAGVLRISTLLYFGGLGMGYMAVEIVLIQRFVMYFGSPLHAAAAILAGMLACSGLGSLLSLRLPVNLAGARDALRVILLLIITYALFLPSLLAHTITLSPAVKILLTLVLISPLALAMGLPFPMGIGCLTRTAEKEIPWAWGINGSLSVVGTVLSTLVAVEFGFLGVMTLAALAYGTALAGGCPKTISRQAATSR